MDCIERESLLKEISEDTQPLNIAMIFRHIHSLPAADVAPVVHGKWMVKQIDSFRKFEVTCSVCGWAGIDNYDSYDDPADYNYCPNCGAKMDLEE